LVRSWLASLFRPLFVLEAQQTTTACCGSRDLAVLHTCWRSLVFGLHISWSET
jgi:hypothetical protein